MVGFDPKDEGTVSLGRAVTDKAFVVPTFSMPAGGLLGEWTRDFVFFNHGCLYTWGGMEVDLIAEWVLTHPDPDAKAAVHLFDNPIFSGIARSSSESDWDRMLAAVHVSHWPSLRDYVRSVSAVDRNRRRFFRTTTQEVDVVDPLVYRKAVIPTPLPLVRVAVFGIDSNAVYVRFVGANSRVSSLAVASRLSPSRATAVLADAMLVGVDAPFRSTESTPQFGPGVKAPSE